MAYETLLVETRNAVATITLNRPTKRNAMSPQLHRDMTAALDVLRDDDAAKVVVITGAGDSFCAGMDLSATGNVFGLDETLSPSLAELEVAAKKRGLRTLKVGAQTLNRLMGLAGDLLVQSSWFEPFSESLLALKRRQHDVGELLETLQGRVHDLPGDTAGLLAEALDRLSHARQATTERYVELEAFALRSTGLSERLYREVRALRIYEGATEVQKLIIARQIMG